jgi:hypothetical protein
MTLSQVTKQLSWFWSLEGIECFDYVFGVFAFALVLNVKMWKLGWLEWWWLGAIYNPNHYSSRCCRWAHRTVRWCTGHNTFHCVPRYPTVGDWSGWPLKSFVLLRHRTVWWHTRQSGAFWLLLCSLYRRRAVDRSVQLTVASLAHRTIRCTPDSPVNYSGVTLRKPESGQFMRCLGLGTRQCPVHTGQCPVRH